MKKHLALLLAVTMLLGLVVVNTAITVSADPTAILEIDFSALAQEKFAPSDSGITPPNGSGVTASGTLAASTAVGFSQRPDAENSLTKGSFQNNNGGAMTYYLDYSDSKIWPNTTSTGTSYANHLTNMQFQNTALEADDNTISFWVNDIQRSYDYVLKSVFTYRIDYNSTNCKSFDLVVNPNGTWNLYSEAWISASNGIHSPMSMDDGAFSVPAGWKHIVITNPARSGGSKTMELYINGEFKKSVTLSIPDDATINHATATFFGKSTAEEPYWRARFNNLSSGKLADVKVYEDALSSSDIASLYSAQLPNFTEYVAPLPSALTKVLDLDMSNFEQVKLTPTDSSGEVTSGIVKSGDLASSTTISFSQRPDEENSLTKGHFKNSTDGTTYYIDYYDSKITPNIAASYANHLTNLQFFNNDLEANDNMISFWVNDITPSRNYALKSVFTYRIDYNSNNCKSFDLVVNPSGTWNLYSEAWISANNGIHNPMSMDDGAFSVPDGWKHILITNPARSGGSKTMDLYINGVLKKSVTLNIPDDATINHATATFFGKSTAEEPYWRARFNNLASGKLGGVGVYTGAITPENVAQIYSDELPYFTELTDIEGYTASDVNVQYDGQSHNIAINAAEDATPGVSIAYTCNGAAFNGATEPGTYEVTATISKTGYNDVEVTATLLIVAPLGSKLFEMNLDNFIPQQTSGTSGITNTGTSNTATFEIHGGTGTYGTRLVEDFLYNKDDYTDVKKVLRFRIVEEFAYTNEPVRTSTFKISDPAFETQPITVSMWVNIDPSSGQQWENAYSSILQYNALRDDDEFRTLGVRNIDGVDKTVTVAEGRARVWQYNLDTMTDYYWGEPWNYNMKIENDQRWWHHLVLTIPQWDVNGTKTCTAYVDGGSRSMTFDLDLDGHSLKDSWISIASDENNVYSPSDISISDVNIYAGEITPDQVRYLYNDEKDFFLNVAARNNITITYGGNEINHIRDVADDGVITINYDENMSDANGVRFLVGAYTEDNELLVANTAVLDGSGSLTLTVPAEAYKVMIFTWDATDYKVLQKFIKLIRIHADDE